MTESSTELTDEQLHAKEQFKEEFGYWVDAYDALLKIDPTFFDRYRTLAAHPWKKGTLDPKVKDFIYIALNSATTHLYNRGIRVHISNAFDHGATVEQILEVLELASVLGGHAVSTGAPVLVDSTGRPEDTDDKTKEEMERLKAEYTDQRGYWADVHEDVMALDHEYFEHYMHFSAHPWNEGVLDPKVKEFIYIALDVSTTHLYETGIRVHVQNALDYGATAEEIMEVFTLASVLGIHTVIEGLPILLDEAKKHGELPKCF